jgi:hypothetical protein
VVVAQLVLVQQPPGGPEPVAIDELDDGDQLLETILQRGAGQHKRIGAVDALERARSYRVPVLDALSFVHDHEVG